MELLTVFSYRVTTKTTQLVGSSDRLGTKHYKQTIWSTWGFKTSKHFSNTWMTIKDLESRLALYENAIGPSKHEITMVISSQLPNKHLYYIFCLIL